MIKKYIIVFSLLFLIFPLVYSKVKNVNILRAEQLIKERNFKEAMQLLTQELINSPFYEDYINKLIALINKEYEAVRQKMNAGITALEKADFVTAEAIFSEINPNGDYGEKINEVVKKSKSMQEEVAKRNNFTDLVRSTESLVTDYKLSAALDLYKQAIEIYKIDNSDDQYPLYAEINFFNQIENQLFKQNFNINFSKEEMNFDYLQTSYQYLAKEKAALTNIEKQLIDLKNMFLKKNDLLSIIEYQAYNSITDKYLTIVYRLHQINYKNLFESLYTYFIEKIKNPSSSSPDDVKIYQFILNNDFLYDAFYQILINYNDAKLVKRSTKNIQELAEYKLKRYELLFNYNIKQISLAQSDNNKVLANYFAVKDQGDLIVASKILNDLSEKNKSTSDKFTNLEAVDKNYQTLLSQTYFTELNQKYQKNVSTSNELSSTITREENDLALINERIKYNLQLADGYYLEAEKYFKAYDYDKAKTSYEKSQEKYVEVRRDTKSEIADRRLTIIEDRLKLIDTTIADRDLKSADDSLAKARTYIYSDDYVNARNELNFAKVIYTKYNINNELLNALDERISKIMKIDAGRKLIVGDPLYEKIIELYNNALILYEKKEYEKALGYVDQILREKPYYDLAKKLETKLLKEYDPESFNLRFNNYFKDAKEYYNTGNYELAISEFQQLLEFGTQTAEINRLIYDCKLKSGIIKPILTEDEKKKAISLYAQAQASYKLQNYEKALLEVTAAIEIWPEVPGGNSLLLEILKRLKQPLPKLTNAELVLFEKANLHYQKKEYKEAYDKTNEILKNASANALQYEQVRQLNKLAFLKMQSSG